MERSTADRSVSTRSLYAAAIAAVSGGYAVLAASGGMGTSGGAWVTLLVGLVALVHGVVLLTPAAARLGGWSGPLMIAYALVMLLTRAAFPTGSMGPATGGGPGSRGGGMGFGMMDGFVGGMGASGGAGMVALAVLMLASGLIMTVRSEEM